MSTVNPSFCSAPSAEPQEEKQPEALRINFDRIDPKLAEHFTGDSTVRHLNRHFMVLQGLNAINRLLLANAVAQDSVEPTMNGTTVGGLLAAAIALSGMATDDMENWANSVELRLRREAGVSHG